MAYSESRSPTHVTSSAEYAETGYSPNLGDGPDGSPTRTAHPSRHAPATGHSRFGSSDRISSSRMGVKVVPSF